MTNKAVFDHKSEYLMNDCVSIQYWLPEAKTT